MHALVLEVPISLFAICIIPAKNRYRKTNIIHYHSKWPANNCLQIMVCSCAMSCNCVWLQIIFCLMRERNHAWYVIAWKKAHRFASRRYSLKNKLGDPMIKQLLIITSVSHINYLPQPSASATNWSARRWQITIFCSTSSNNC